MILYHSQAITQAKSICPMGLMRHFVVAEVVRLRVELPASLRILTNPATSQLRPRAL